MSVSNIDDATTRNLFRRVERRLAQSEGQLGKIFAGSQVNIRHSLLLELDYASSGHTGFASQASLDSHTGNVSNPHVVTLDQAVLAGDTATTDAIFEQDLTVGADLSTVSQLRLHGGQTTAMSGSERGGSIEWSSGNPAGVGGYSFLNSNDDLAFKATAQSQNSDTGTCRIDLSAGDSYWNDVITAGTVHANGGAGIQMDVGTFISDVANSGGATCFNFNTTNAITGGGAASGNLRDLLLVQNNNTEAFNVYADGVARSANGFYAGAFPIDSNYPSNYNLFQHEATDDANHNGLFVSLTNSNSAIGNRHHVGVECRIIDNATSGTNTGANRGMTLSADVLDSGARTVSEIVCGVFGFRFNAGFSNATTVATAVAGQFEYNDLSTVTNADAVTFYFLRLTNGGSAGKATVGNAYGVRIPDMTDVGDGGPSTKAVAIQIDAQSANGSATYGNLLFVGGDFNDGHIQLGDDGHVWVESGSGALCFSDGNPSSTTDYDFKAGADFMYSGAGRIMQTTRVTGTYTVLATDHQIAADTDGGAFTATLPAGVAGTEYRIANTGTSGNNLTIAPNGAELLIGVNSNFVLLDGEALNVVYEATEGWF